MIISEKLAAPPPLASSAPTPAAITTTPFNTGRVTIKTECLAPDSSKGRNSHVQRRANTVQQDTGYYICIQRKKYIVNNSEERGS